VKITPIILSGGSGTRLWPISRQLNPKQFLNFFGKNSLFQQTIMRVFNQEIFNPAIIICNQEHRFLAEEQLQQINYQNYQIILEPESKNTAPAIAIGAMATQNFLQKNNFNNFHDLMLIMPCDHLISNPENFIENIAEITKIYQENKELSQYLTTLGINPTNAETGYGYINSSNKILAENNKIVLKLVENFIEKPSLAKANQLILDKNNIWNSGIFLTKASFYLQKLKLLQNNIFQSCLLAYQNAKNDLNFLRLNEQDFAKNDNLSIDYALLEKMPNNLAVLPLKINWSDVGNWESIANLSPKDEENNSKIGRIINLKTSNCYIYSPEKITTTIGVDNLIIINLKDALLIANKNNAQEVKNIFELLQKNNFEEAISTTKKLRPWGSFEVLDCGNGFKLKKIIVKPMQALSLQMHNYRCEHWVVTHGVANVLIDDREFILNANESTYINAKQKHRLINKSQEILEIIEVQTGKYLEEDDIIRFEDKYGR